MAHNNKKHCTGTIEQEQIVDKTFCHCPKCNDRVSFDAKRVGEPCNKLVENNFIPPVRQMHRKPGCDSRGNYLTV